MPIRGGGRRPDVRGPHGGPAPGPGEWILGGGRKRLRGAGTAHGGPCRADPWRLEWRLEPVRIPPCFGGAYLVHVEGSFSRKEEARRREQAPLAPEKRGKPPFHGGEVAGERVVFRLLKVFDHHRRRLSPFPPPRSHVDLQHIPDQAIDRRALASAFFLQCFILLLSEPA